MVVLLAELDSNHLWVHFDERLVNSPTWKSMSVNSHILHCLCSTPIRSSNFVYSRFFACL